MAHAPDPTLETDLCGIVMRSPVMLAAGTAGLLDEMASVTPLPRVGAVVTKSITAEPRAGNPTWRILESRVGMLNAIGLANPGIEAFEREVLPRAEAMPTRVIGSIAGSKVEDYAAVAGVMRDWIGRGLDGVEINVSCPNVATGTQFGDSPDAVGEVVEAVRGVCGEGPIFVKLSPTGWDPVEIALAAVRAGADGLTLSNTAPAMEIDVDTRRPRLANVTGGLSGPALHPITLRLVWMIAGALDRVDLNARPRPAIVACGGVRTWRDAAAYVLAGASAVQVGATLFAEPRAPVSIARGLSRWARREGVSNVRDLVGKLEIDAG